MWAKAVVSATTAVVIWLCAVILAMSARAEGQPQKISQKDAVKIAEKFVAENGYTASNRVDALAFERGAKQSTLEPKAYGVTFNSAGGYCWTIIFQYTKEEHRRPRLFNRNDLINPQGVGRAITMDEFGHQVTMQHQDIFLKSAKIKL